jgi:hypothetical protein
MLSESDTEEIHGAQNDDIDINILIDGYKDYKKTDKKFEKLIASVKF